MINKRILLDVVFTLFCHFPKNYYYLERIVFKCLMEVC